MKMMRCLLGMMMVFAMTTVGAKVATASGPSDELFQMQSELQTRWATFENQAAEQGAGGQENEGWKGRPAEEIAPGQTVELVNLDGPGTVRRMWMTINQRDPKMLRSLRLRMYWDGADEPAVDVPLGDFFNAVLGQMHSAETALFSTPQGRSFNSYVPMPFRENARITFTNEDDRPVRLYYEVNLTVGDEHDEDMLYFHAHWRRENPTTLGENFEILPQIEGRGKFLGTHIGVIESEPNRGYWFGEGEVLIFLDGDDQNPTLQGTGTEDYIGTGWGQQRYINRYQGASVDNNEHGYRGFYRYHIPDPVIFHEEIRVEIQQLGGARKSVVEKLMEEGVPVKPVSVGFIGNRRDLFDGEATFEEARPNEFTVYQRQDDVSAVAFFYLDRPTNGLPELAPVAERVEGLVPLDVGAN